MKKKLFLIPLAVLLLCVAAVPALASGLSGNAAGSADLRYNNMQFAPVSGSSFTEGNIPWYCSVQLSPGGDKEWSSYYSTDIGRFDKVRVVLYRLNSSSYWGVWQSYYKTLSTESYAKLRSVYFSDGGVVNLPAGSYRISLEALWDGATGENFTVVRTNDFVVNPRPAATATPKPTPRPTATPTPRPQLATVTLVHRLSSTGQVLYQIDVQAPSGYQTFYPYWGSNEYDLITSPNVSLYLYPNGHYYVYFEYAPKYVAPTAAPTPVPTPRPTPKPTAVPTPRPAIPTPGYTYDPQNPFLYGIQEYDYCLAPEYCVDPDADPMNYCYLYSKASDINGRNMGRYEKGETVKVINYYGGNHGKWNYCYVITKDNKLGYMHDYALKPIEESPYYQQMILNQNNGW